MVALSVSTSRSGSPFRTGSPSRLSHFATVPSVMVSERRGITISSGMTALPPAPDRQQPALRQHCPRCALDLVLAGQRRLLQRLGVGHGYLGPAHALHGGVQVVEACPLDARRQLGGHAEGGPALLRAERALGLAH